MKRRKKRNKRNRKKSTFFLGAILILLTVIVIARRYRIQEGVSKETLRIRFLQVPIFEFVKKEEWKYPEPNYPFDVEDVDISIPDLDKDYTIAWVSDLHLITDHEPAEDVTEESMETIEQRYETIFITDDEVPKHSADLWPEIVKFLNSYEKLDGIIFGGDMMDYCSRSNIEVFKEGFERINPDIPLLYIRADHDYGAWYGGEAFTEDDAHEVHKEIDGDDPNEKYIDFGEFIVIGVNGSTKNMPDWQFNTIKQWYEWGKPVIAVTHVPYASKIDSELEELSMGVRNTKYYWDWSSEIYIPNDVTGRYLTEFIYSSDTPVRKVLAGHLHAEWDGMLTEQLSQHIFSPAYSGVIGIIHVKSDD